MNFLALIGRFFFSFLEATGRLSLFVWAAFSGLLRPPFYTKQLTKQLIEIGYYSLPVVGLTAVFIGAALALNILGGVTAVCDASAALAGLRADGKVKTEGERRGMKYAAK